MKSAPSQPSFKAPSLALAAIALSISFSALAQNRPPLVLTAPRVPVAPAAPAPLSAAAQASIADYLALDLNNLFPYASPNLPAHYAGALAADNTPAGNPVTNTGATLGRVLFNDKRLSVNGTVACASCHQQANGFADDQRFSAGVVVGAATTAHAMRLGNSVFYSPGTQSWDKRTASLEAQATQPIQAAVEMGFDAPHGGMAALLARMQALPYYPPLFQWAFGTPVITEARIQRSLAQYERAMVTMGSRWDAGYATVFSAQLPDRGLSLNVPGLSVQENAGRRLFMGTRQQGGVGCAGCHTPPSFALSANSRSNGLDAGNSVVFKAPSLKNVGLGKAFMHDGRFATLAQVVDHYDHGVKDGPALDNRLKSLNGQPRVLNLSAADKAALVSFMNTLTDTAFLADARFSNPFNK